MSGLSKKDNKEFWTEGLICPEKERGGISIQEEGMDSMNNLLNIQIEIDTIQKDEVVGKA